MSLFDFGAAGPERSRHDSFKYHFARYFRNQINPIDLHRPPMSRAFGPFRFRVDDVETEYVRGNRRYDIFLGGEFVLGGQAQVFLDECKNWEDQNPTQRRGYIHPDLDYLSKNEIFIEIKDKNPKDDSFREQMKREGILALELDIEKTIWGLRNLGRYYMEWLWPREDRDDLQFSLFHSCPDVYDS